MTPHSTARSAQARVRLASTGDGRRRVFGWTALTALALVSLACSSDSIESEAEAAPSASTNESSADGADDGATLRVIAESVPTNVLAAQLTVESDESVQVDVVASDGDHVVEVPTTALEATEHVVPLVGLRADRTYDVEVTATGPDGASVASTTVTTGALPEFLPDYELTTSPSKVQPGLTLVEATPTGSAPGLAFAIDDDGEVVWYYQSSPTVSAWSMSPAGTMHALSYPFEFREVDMLGQQLEQWEFAVTADSSWSTTTSPATRVEIPWSVGSAVGGALVNSPHHDISVLPNGNLLGLARVTEDASPELRQASCPDDDREWDLVSDVAIEFEPGGTVVRTWNVSDAIDPESQPGVHLCADGGLFASPTERDWSHANAVSYDPERDVIIVSVRHTDSIVAFEYGDEPGHQSEVRWVLGAEGTVPIDGEPFFHQHAPEFENDGSILVYDNGNDRPGGELYSRAVQYDLIPDGASGLRAVQTWEHRVDDIDGTPLYAEFLGDVDRLDNGNVLITHGGIGGPQSEDQRSRIIEVVPEGESGGEIVFDLRLGDDELGFTSYRSERLASLYSGPMWESPDAS